MSSIGNFLRVQTLILLLYAPAAFSQNVSVSPEDLKNLPPEIAEQLKHKPLMEVATGRLKLHPAFPQMTAQDPDWVSPLPVTLHMKGTAGTPLPSVKKQPRPPLRSPEERHQEALTSAAAIARSASNSGKIPPLPECSRDKTTFEEFASPLATNTIRDLLFIKPQELPLNPDEAFGKKTIIVAYNPAKPVNWSVYGKLLGIKCLPSRVRQLGRGIARAEGLPALKNYDEDPYGSGKLSDSVKARSQRLFNE